MAIVKGVSFADAFTSPRSADEIFLDYIMDLCVIVYDRMEELGIDQKTLAERMGKRESQISRLLSGEANFTLKTLSQLDEALGLNLSIKPVPTDVTLATTSYTVPSGSYGSRGSWGNQIGQVRSTAKVVTA